LRIANVASATSRHVARLMVVPASAILRGQLHLDAATRQDRAHINGTRTARARLARLIDAGQ
jgi:hypothetical protein